MIEDRQLARYTVTSMPVLNRLLKNALENSGNYENLRQSVVVYIHHAFKTSVELIKAILALGVKPENFYVLGKHYSETLYAAEELKSLGIQYQPSLPQEKLGTFSQNFIKNVCFLWGSVSKNITTKINSIVVLDHGGYALSLIPKELTGKFNIVGLEKTTGGIINFHRYGYPGFPIVDVARSAAKKILEPPLISNEVILKIRNHLSNKNNLKCGVVGCGAIGKAVANELLSMGYKIMLFDSQFSTLKHFDYSRPVIIANTLYEIIKHSDYIFGCTGRDITKNSKLFNQLTGNKTLISCSSGDVEFETLLRLAQLEKNMTNGFEMTHKDVSYHSKSGAAIKIVNSGFPVNFDCTDEASSPKDIQITRSLAFAGLLQCAQLLKTPSLLYKKGLYMLEPKLQKFVAEEWLAEKPKYNYSDIVTKGFSSIEWISKNSSGRSLDSLTETAGS